MTGINPSKSAKVFGLFCVYRGASYHYSPGCLEKLSEKPRLAPRLSLRSRRNRSKKSYSAALRARNGNSRESFRPFSDGFRRVVLGNSRGFRGFRERRGPELLDSGLPSYQGCLLLFYLTLLPFRLLLGTRCRAAQQPLTVASFLANHPIGRTDVPSLNRPTQ
jgi:hypothetical protein